MPSIITHHRVAHEFLIKLDRFKDNNLARASLVNLLENPDYRKAFFFGIIGPDLLDYTSGKKDSIFPRKEFTQMLHDGGAFVLCEGMLQRLYHYNDYNFDWGANQRAYLYGFILHLMTDSVFNPFIFYWSGYPFSNEHRRRYYFYHRYVNYSYQLDQYFEYHYKTAEGYVFNIKDMILTDKNSAGKNSYYAVKNLVLETFHRKFDNYYKKLVSVYPDNSDAYYFNSYGKFDSASNKIEKIHVNKKKKGNRTGHAIYEWEMRHNFIRSEERMKYPNNMKVDFNVVNLVRERWQYPAFPDIKSNDSADELLEKSVDGAFALIVEIENQLISGNKALNEIVEKLPMNLYTGSSFNTGYRSFSEMKVRRPIPLRNQ